MNDDDNARYAGIMAMRDEHGEGALTQEDWDFLQAYQPATAHGANLAEFLDERDLGRIGRQVMDWVEQDEESREPWQITERTGIRLLGVSPNVEGGADFDGASTVVHPLLAEACVRFASITIGSLWPPGGPVKCTALGSQSRERMEQATRVEQFMNYQYSELMPGAFEQTDKMLHRLPLSGSCFIKIYVDPILGICRRFVEPADFIVPYNATDLATSPRYTERVDMSRNEVRRRQVQGLYRDIDLPAPSRSGGTDDGMVISDEVDDIEGRAEPSRLYDDIPHTLYECYCEYDLPGFEDADGVALPYIITVDRTNGAVLSIYRNWDERDIHRRRKIYHIHYRFTPGLGFYGFGYYHWLGGLARSSTGTLRALLDAAQFSNLQGGFRSRDAKVDGGNITIAPGEWTEVDCTQEELQKAFFRIPYGEPSRALMELLPHLEELARRFAGTTEVAVGEGSGNVPVGTTLARIEQAGKVMTAIQLRLHQAQKEEFKTLAWMDSRFLPQEYPYAVSGEDRTIFQSDFDSRIDVVPASDPNFVSNTQRYFIAQAAMELAAQAPQIYNLRALHERMLVTLRIENIEEILPKDAAKRLDPVSENALMMTGKPVEAKPDQNHGAHIQVHAALLNDPKQAQKIGGAVEAHIQDHLAHTYLLQMQQMIGAPIPMDEVPPEMESQIAMMAAAAMAQIGPNEPSQPPGPDPAVLSAQADIRRKDEVAAADIRRRDVSAAADIERQQTKMLLDQQNKFPMPPRIV